MKAFLIELLIISLLMAAVVLVIGAFSKKLENRFSASCRYVIWLVVIARLALPFAGILSPALVTIPLAEEQAAESPEAWKDSFVVSGEAQKEDTPVSGNEDAGEDSQSTVPQGSTQPVKPAEPPVYNGAIEETQKSEENKFNSAIIAPVLFAVWAAGAVIFLAVNLVRYNTLKETMKRNLSPADGRVEEIYGELCREMGIKKAPALYSSPLAQSPMLCGYFKAKIIVPRLSVPEGSLRAVLTHELTHYKRGDVWVKLLALFANSIHWFNPAVYGAVSRLNREMELSCDEKTLLGADEEMRVDYGRTMLDIVSRCRGGEAVLTTKFNPKKNASGERIRNILDTRKKGRGIAIIISTVAVCIIAGVIIGCEAKKPDVGDDVAAEDSTKPEENDTDVTTSPDDATAEETTGEADITAPEDTTAADTTAPPADTTAKPVDTTARPADTTAKPVDTTVSAEIDLYNKAKNALIVLDEPLKSQVSDAWMYKPLQWYTINPDSSTSVGIRCYGNFEGCVVLFSPTPMQVETTEVIANSEFSYSTSFALHAYYDGRIYSLEEAHEKGFISAEEIAIAAERHKTVEEFRDFLKFKKL